MAYDKEEAKARAKQRANFVADKTLKAFETGKVGEAMVQTFLSCGGRHCDAYSWKNRLLVFLGGFTDAMGFKQWLAVGRCVNKGEKAFYIWAPMVRKFEDKATGETTTRTCGFTTQSVFGLEQTKVIDEVKWAKHNKVNEKAEAFLSELPLRAVAESWGLEVRAFDGRRSSALGWYRHGQAIAVGVENLATWAHELVHAADDKAGKLVERGQHWRSETVAELGGAILMRCLGYETEADLGGAWEYIGKYAQAADIEPLKACLDVLDRTCEAVALILQTADDLSDKRVASTDSDEQVASTESDKSVASVAA